MGFMDDIWAVLLSDDADEEEAAVERIAADAVASQIARSVLTGLVLAHPTAMPGVVDHDHRSYWFGPGSGRSSPSSSAQPSASAWAATWLRTAGSTKATLPRPTEAMSPAAASLLR